MKKGNGNRTVDASVATQQKEIFFNSLTHETDGK